MTIDDKENEWENDAIDDNWEKWARKTNIERRYVRKTIDVIINITVNIQYKITRYKKTKWNESERTSWKELFILIRLLY